MSMWGVFRRRPTLPPQPSQSPALAALSGGVAPLVAEAASFAITAPDIALSTAFLCEPASFAIAAQDAVLLAAQPLQAETASFAIAAQDLLFAGRVSCEAASFALSGQALALSSWLVAEVAAFTISGQAATLLEAVNLQAAGASFEISGQALAFAERFVCEGTSFSLSGQVIGQAWPAAAAAFTLSGQPIAFGAALAIGAATFTLNGQAIGQAWAAAPAAFTLVGQDVILFTAISMIASPALYLLTGRPIWSRYSPDHPVEGAPAEFSPTEFPGESGISIYTAPAAFTVAGQPLSLRPALSAQPAAFTLSGGAANQSWLASAAAFAIAGQPVAFVDRLMLSAGAFLLAGQAIGQAWAAAPAAFALAGVDVVFTEARLAEPAAFTVTAIDVHFLDLEVAHFDVNAQPLTFAWSMAAGAASFTVSGQDVVFLNNKLFDAEAGAFTLAGQDIGFGRGVGAEPAAFTITGQPTAEVIRLLCGAASFAVSGQALALNVAFKLATGMFRLVGVAIVDVVGPSGDHDFLIEIEAHNGSEVETYFLSCSGFRALPTDVRPNQFYVPRVKDPGNFAQRIGLPGEDDVSASSGDIILASGDQGDGVTLDDWPSKGFGKRPLRILALPRGAKSLASALNLFRGRTKRLLSSDPYHRHTIRIANKLAVLDQPLLSARFAGTTLSTGNSAEGTADLKDQLKQQCWGECSTVPLQAANPWDAIYLVSNVTAFSQLVSIQLYDGGLALINDGDDPDIATLRSNAGSTSEGHYRTCLALGLVMVGALPAKRLTADVVEGTTAADRTAAKIALRMMRQYGIELADILTGSFDDLDTKNSAVCGCFVADDRAALSELKVLFNSVGGRLLPNRNDLFEVTRFEEPTPSPTLDYDLTAKGISFERLEGSPPTKAVELQWGRVYAPQQESDLLAGVSGDRRSYLGQEIRTARAFDAGVETKHLDAGTIRYETRLVNQDDADAESERILDLMKVERDEYKLRVPLEYGWAAQVGGSIVLRHPSRLGLSGGKAFAVLQRSDIYLKEQVGFDRVWG